MNPEALVIGANGLIGRYVTKALTKASISWKGTYCKRPDASFLKLNFLEEEEIKNILFSLTPKVVFLCSNLAGGVDFSQRHPKEARAFHVQALQKLGVYCHEIQAFLFFISTDYVFDGTRGPYEENASPCPLNVYGRLKLEAEEWLQIHLSNYVIIRTTNVYGWDPDSVTPNYLMQLYRAMQEGKSFYAPSFLYGQPTYARDLAQAMVELYQKKACGLYHIVGESMVNRWEWALQAASIFEFNYELIQERKTLPPSFVLRPLRSELSCQKFKSSFQTVLHDIKEGLELMKDEMVQSQPQD